MTAETPLESNSDLVKLRFTGRNDDGSDLHELRASHVAEVLQGLVGLSSDFSKAGVFGDGPGGEVLVRPAEEGSFVIEVVRVAQEAGPYLAAAGVPTLSQIIWWSTKAARANVKDFDYLDNGNVKVVWQDDTVNEISREVWRELEKRKRRRKKQLRQIMAPLSDKRVEQVQVSDELETTDPPEHADYVLGPSDYEAVRLEDEVTENVEIFESEAQMSAVNFDDPTNWKVRVPQKPARNAKMEDSDFLLKVDRGLSIKKTDIFRLKIREDAIVKNGRPRTKWTVLEVLSHREAAGDDNS